jgi:DNA recombination protein RmuC
MVRRAENIRELGAKVKKKLPQSLIDRMNDGEQINNNNILTIE